MSETPPPPAGWYRDPADPSRSRWWDGHRWSNQQAPPPPQTTPPPPAPAVSFATTTTASRPRDANRRRGWIVAGLAVAIAVVLGIGTWLIAGRSGPETATVDGTFVLHADYDSLSTDAFGCIGDGGYGDINSSTSVVLTNKEGKEIDRVPLGPGSLDGDDCTFHLTLKATKGSDYYLISISDRGVQQYTWETLTTPGTIDISLGD